MELTTDIVYQLVGQLFLESRFENERLKATIQTLQEKLKHAEADRDAAVRAIAGAASDSTRTK